jgi:PKD repeat protein
MAKRFSFIAVAGLIAVSACGVHQVTAPSTAAVGGTSTFALSLDMTATPDSITQDGASQSSVVVTAHGPDGKPMSGVSIRLAMSVDGVTQDFGTLSARTLVTGSDGAARAVYTAPPSSPLAGGSGKMISIAASASGTNAQAPNASTVAIRLVPPGVILPPAQTPVAQFTVTPTPINFNIPVTFDGSTSCAVPLVGGVCQAAIPGTPTVDSIVSFAWTFGDGTTGSGRTVTHSYAPSSAASFSATLTVTNDRGLAASATQTVSATASPAPTGDWVSSPADPVINQDVFFNADAVRAALGHSIVQYSWNFGDNSADATANGFQVTHKFTQAGNFLVVLSVLDDAGQKTVVPAHTLKIGNGLPTATLLLTKLGGNSVRADGSNSAAASGFTIVTYRFVWDDNTPDDVGTSPSVPHTFAAAGSHTVTLFVTDNAGRTAASLPGTITVP